MKLIAAIAQFALVGSLGGAVAALIIYNSASGYPIASVLVLGLAYGLGTTPLLVETLRGRNLRITVPAAFVPSLLLTMLAAVLTRDSHAGAVTFSAGLSLSCLLIGWFLPTAPSTPPHCCSHCGYDMTLNASGLCPECGGRWNDVQLPLGEEAHPWSARLELFLRWWTGCILSAILAPSLATLVGSVFQL